MGLEIVELLMRIEEDFGLEIPDQDAELLVSIGSMEEYVARRLGVLETDRTQLLQRLILIVAEEFSLNPSQLSRETRFVEDLHLG